MIKKPKPEFAGTLNGGNMAVALQELEEKKDEMLVEALSYSVGVAQKNETLTPEDIGNMRHRVDMRRNKEGEAYYLDGHAVLIVQLSGEDVDFFINKERFTDLDVEES